jgi:homoserine dehydrogenase
MASLPLADFLIRSKDLDDGMAARVREARAGGRALRYVAQITAGQIAVGLLGVPKDTAIGSLRGNDNLIAFHSRYYPTEPLILQGRGAGVDAAAAGVHSDIVALAKTMASGQ